MILGICSYCKLRIQNVTVQHILAEKLPYHPQMLLLNLLEKFQRAIALTKMELIKIMVQYRKVWDHQKLADQYRI